MKNVDWKDVIMRAVKTFVQTAVSYLVINLAGVDFFNGNTTEATWIGLVLSSGASGLSAVWNGVISPLIKPPVKTESANDADEDGNDC